MDGGRRVSHTHRASRERRRGLGGKAPLVCFPPGFVSRAERTHMLVSRKAGAEQSETLPLTLVSGRRSLRSFRRSLLAGAFIFVAIPLALFCLPVAAASPLPVASTYHH